MNISSLLLTCGAVALALTGCKVGPDFKGAPAQDLPATWANKLPPATDSESLVKWWNLFGDNQLSNLIEEGLAANPDTIMAALSIKEAESSAKIAGAALLPAVSASASQTTSPSGGFRSTSHGEWSASANASWELDLFGGSRRNIEAALANLHSTQASAGAVQTALTANIASAYFDWIEAKESLRIAKAQLEYQKKTLDIVRRRHSAGLEAKLDLEQSLSQVASTESSIPAQEAAIKTAENTLAVYLGTHMSRINLHMPSEAVYNRIPSVPVGLPSELLRRRPDIIQAEATLHQATANVGVAVADLFPKISLTGSASTSGGSDFTGFFRERRSTWSLGGSLSQNIFQGGSLLEQIRLRKTEVANAEESYRKAVLDALSEVETCLINYAQVMLQIPLYEAQEKSDAEAARLSLQLYNAGETDFLNVVTAQQSWLSSQLQLVTARQSVRQNLANLCKVLGGGWDSSRVTAR
ncbi:MAG: TolC family protein [Akkermansiaceae bacterium]|nr:TolC family protein [Akkermansiaceae bacterium]